MQNGVYVQAVYGLSLAGLLYSWFLGDCLVWPPLCAGARVCIEQRKSGDDRRRSAKLFQFSGYISAMLLASNREYSRAFDTCSFLHVCFLGTSSEYAVTCQCSFFPTYILIQSGLLKSFATCNKLVYDGNKKSGKCGPRGLLCACHISALLKEETVIRYIVAVLFTIHECLQS